MAIWKFKSCPRCGGDIFLDADLAIWYEHCLQCGYLRYMPGTAKVRHRNERHSKKELSRRSSRVTAKTAAAVGRN